jgi:hypothetical protein
MVMNGTAKETAGGLKAKNLVAKDTSAGVRYVSKAASNATLKNPKAMLWIKMCQEWMKKHKSKDGAIVLMPKRGTKEHGALVKKYHAMIKKEKL